MREIPTGKLNKRVKAVWRLGGFLKTALCGVVCFGAAFGFAFIVQAIDSDASGGPLFETVPPAFYAAAAITLLIFLIYVLIAPPIRYARFRYAILDDEIDIYRGIIVRKRIIVPLIRVQYTDTTQGPLLRAFGLAAVKVYTAAGAQDIEGLLVADAEALRDKVAILAKQVQEDV